MDTTHNNIESLLLRFNDKSPQEVLSWFLSAYSGRIALASGLGAEGQVLTDMISKIDKSIRIFTIDTGRLFPESYKLIDRNNRRYEINMEVFFPDHKEVESYILQHGINGFYDSVEKRKACCHARKMEPLKRALANLDVWICGLRNEQSITRKSVQMIEWDESNGLIKLNPLIHWTEDEVWKYIKFNNVPYNRLHDKGFPSIGCQPCTRAVESGHDIRSGRWWWENPDHKECGLHVKS